MASHETHKRVAQFLMSRQWWELAQIDVETLRRLGRTAGALLGLGLEVSQLRRAAGVEA